FAKEQKAISISEFFEKNKHLLGFDNPTKSLLMAVKEACDNSLDACQEAGILPDVIVKIKNVKEDIYEVSVQDNGPGIVKEQLPRVFGKLLYGSKFHRLFQSLTADEPVLVLNEGKAALTAIGPLVDSYIGTEGVREISDREIFVPAFDPKSKRYTIKKVSHVIRHKRENEILRIKLATNREIKVTGCHSLFTLDTNTLNVQETEARKLRQGDYIIVPRQIPALGEIREVNVLDYLSSDNIKNKWLYVYGFDRAFLQDLFFRAEVIHKKTDKSRRFYRIGAKDGEVDILDDSMKQYVKMGFLPLHLVLRLGLKDAAKGCVIRSYKHGKKYEFPVDVELSPSFMRFLGLYVAEGHTDRRQIGFTFGKHEMHLVDEIVHFSALLGLNFTVEQRDRSVRVKIFGEILSKLMGEWCGKGAKAKRVPEFVFRSAPELRKAFIRGYIEGDGHVREDIIYMTTASRQLANEVLYLLLTLGLVASVQKKEFRGLGKTPSTCFVVHFQRGRRARAYERIPLSLIDSTSAGTVAPQITRLMQVIGVEKADIAKKYWSILDHSKADVLYSLSELKGMSQGRITKTHINRLAELGFIQEQGGLYVLLPAAKEFIRRVSKLIEFTSSDLCLLPVKEIEILNGGYEYVYDLSVPGYENFVGGWGGIACHNSRGQQGIGISSVTLYSQLTTGEPTKVWSKIESQKKTHYIELHLNTVTNEPDIMKQEDVDKDLLGEHGVKVVMTLHGRYRKTVEDYLKQTSVSNPFAKILYTAPDGTKTTYPRSVNELPKPPKTMKPHPYGMEFGVLQRLLQNTSSRTLLSFLTNEFSSVGMQSAKEICKIAKVQADTKPSDLDRAAIEKIIKAMQSVKIQRPPLDCLSPIGASEMERSLKKEYPNAEFVTAITREPSVYRGF
ncbi:hypothetical protein HY639_05100, partial [Candidatus Woesearchaeota archaeon]|nr:hypothetical protein [Candidatus Woesearchaeota archaeon]